MRTETRYIADDGREFEEESTCRRYEAEHLHGCPYDCPKCKTTGKMNGKPVIRSERDLEAEGYAGYKKDQAGIRNLSGNFGSSRWGNLQRKTFGKYSQRQAQRGYCAADVAPGQDF